MPFSFWKKSPPREAKCFQWQDHLASSRNNQTEQDNLLRRTPPFLDVLQASSPAEYSVLAGLVSLPPVYILCHNNFDNFSDRTNSMSPCRSFSFPMLSPVGHWSASEWVVSIFLLLLTPSPCPVTTQDYFLNQLDLQIPLSRVLPDALHHEGDKKRAAAFLLISPLFSVEASRPQVLLKSGRKLGIYLFWSEAKPLIPLSVLQC